MRKNKFSQLDQQQRTALQALAAGAQLLYKWGRWDAYQEVAGKTVPSGVSLSTEQLTGLMDAVPAISLEPNPGPGQAFGFAWLPAAHRAACAEQITLTMRTEHLRVQSKGSAMPQWPLELTEPPARERMVA